LSSITHFLTEFYGSYDIFLHGLWLTLELSVVSLVVAVVIGLFFAFLKLSRIGVLGWIADIYIWVVRGTPVVVQIFILYYGLTVFVTLSAFSSGVVALAFHNGAYIAEIFRGSIQAVDKGQNEAGRSLGMTAVLTMRRIILPQAFRRSIPALCNQFIIGVKDSSLVSFIGMQELFGVANALGSNNFDYLTYYLIVAAYYLCVVLILMIGVNMVERKLAASD